MPAVKLTTKYPIPDDIRTPAIDPTAEAKTKYPWRKAKVGESFFVPASEASVLSMRSMASRWGKATQTRWCVRQWTTPDRVHGSRIWRVE